MQLSHFNPHMFQFVKTLRKQETENFASVLCCFTRTYLGLSPQFFAGKACLGAFICGWPKQDTENFASVWCCFTRTYLGLSPQFLLGKLAWGLSYVHGIEPTATPLVPSVASPFSIQSKASEISYRLSSTASDA